MLSANPQYVSATDLSLQGSSVCIDVGTSTGAPATDITGAARPLDGDGFDGAAFDMGAYEFVFAAECGNGVTEAGEACDSGTANGSYGACDATCSGPGPRCGDGVTNGPEACDDGNASNTDTCLNTCVQAVCGDGFVHAGVEQCDDANADNGDGCVANCQLARCGDGFVQTGAEQCDDANDCNNDACLNNCAAATCGDGFVEIGVEICDDGNRVDNDVCDNTCIPVVCHDDASHGGGVGVESAQEPSDLEAGGGCNSAGGQIGGLSAAFLALVLRRRRRS